VNDFWLSCGHHLLDRDAGGGLLATDEFLKAYLARPELAPPPEACAAERALHAALLDDPRRLLGDDDIAALQDADARQNWQVMIAFRDLLLRHRTLEATYLALVREGPGRTPPLFLNQLAHVILRNVLDGCDDPWALRAGELFFRPQIVTLHEGSLLAADEETIGGAGGGPVSPLVSMLGLPAASAIDVLSAENASTYFGRSDRFDMALDLTAGRRGLAALGEVIGRWVRHMLAVDVTVEPLGEVHDARFTWYVGLDAEGTKVGDRLWQGQALDEATRGRVIGLFGLRFADPSVVDRPIGEEPVYLILAMTPERIIRLKPQNLVTGLPVRHPEAVS
jgi:Family of unknown function (DUF6352)